MSALYLGDNKLSGVISDWIFELPRFVDPPYEGYHLCLWDNYFSNYAPAIHCTHGWQHEDGGNPGARRPTGSNTAAGLKSTSNLPRRQIKEGAKQSSLFCYKL